MPAWWIVALAVVVAAMVAVRLYNQLASRRCRCATRMDDKVVIVTGANAGIGMEVARDLAARGARVIMACRNLEKANEARDEIVASTGNREVVVRHVDLLSLRSVRDFARGVLREETRLDVLVNNAGTFGLPFAFTDDDLVQGMQANHFGPFLLTCLLLVLLRKTAMSRVVVVASCGHRYGNFDIDNMNGEKGYGVLDTCMWSFHSKLCNVLMAVYLARKLQGTGITVNSLHPGVVRTDIGKKIPTLHGCGLGAFILGFFGKSTEMGAQTVIHVAVSRECGRVTGKYFVNLEQEEVGAAAKTPGLAEEVWKRCEKYVKLAEDEKPF